MCCSSGPADGSGADGAGWSQAGGPSYKRAGLMTCKTEAEEAGFSLEQRWGDGGRRISRTGRCRLGRGGTAHCGWGDSNGGFTLWDHELLYKRQPIQQLFCLPLSHHLFDGYSKPACVCMCVFKPQTRVLVSTPQVTFCPPQPAWELHQYRLPQLRFVTHTGSGGSRRGPHNAITLRNNYTVIPVKREAFDRLFC